MLNVTPDSFSDGGRFVEPGAALEYAQQMIRAGASVIDVGGESSRPAGVTYGAGAAGVAADEELRRVLPVIDRLVRVTDVPISIDTVKPEVAAAALRAGARIVNDVSCAADPELLRVVVSSSAELVVMHTRGRGDVSGNNVVYRDLVADVRAELLAAVDRAVAAGVDRRRIWIDPGLGFAKTPEQSLALLARLEVLTALDLRVLVGPSRKAFIARHAPDRSGAEPGPDARLAGTCVAACVAQTAGARAVRVHDVAQVRQALLVDEAIRRASRMAGSAV